MTAIRLGVNIDHVATVRQARLAAIPDPVEAAVLAEKGGADGITVHLREDRRHIQDHDVERLRRSIRTKLNLEMAATAEMLAKALLIRPDDACLVPERRQELTTEGGLDVRERSEDLRRIVTRLREAGIHVSLFVDPETAQIETSAKIGANAVELHTGSYCDAKSAVVADAELSRLLAGAAAARELGLEVHAGHGLRLDNVAPVAAIPEVVEVNIGHSIVARAILIGMEGAVREMRTALDQARGLP